MPNLPLGKLLTIYKPRFPNAWNKDKDSALHGYYEK